ncbi:DUF4350 domain-containing protein [Chondromyces crocatus]|uniref:DUF4350 domain-containing protein n=1 Tax=Chondromyces crocatus TaxID=52 RepID=A0A0K1EG50_CHOCO|nr:DUF4350 domain-containing protein [Chondromyces crocatus]AKT39824.1 uncharacterized protein CMC5_039750 [Chondromyces crocatus]
MGIALAALLVLATPLTALAGAFDVNDNTWEGCSEFLEIARAELGSARVSAVAVLDWSRVQPEDGVLVLHPVQPIDPEESTAFMKAGGRLAIVDDFGRGDDTLKRFKIERTATPSRPVASLRGRAALALAEPVIDAVGGQAVGPHPVVSNVQKLVTNHPTGLRHPNLSPVLRIRAINEPDVVIAVAGQVEKGRLFAMSDPSALINLMLRYPGNRAFGVGLVRYLVDEDGSQAQRGRLFIVANRFDQEGTFGGETTLRKELDAQVAALLRMLEEARQEGFPAAMLLALAAMAALGVAVWVARTAARPYRSPLPRYARPVPLVAQGGVAGRFAVLAAPTSPRSLMLLELKSALFEAMALRFGLGADPSVDALTQLVAREGGLDERTFSDFKEVLSNMQRVEASVVAGKPTAVSRPALSHAAKVVRDVLAACHADGTLRLGVESSPGKGAA